VESEEHDPTAPATRRLARAKEKGLRVRRGFLGGTFV